MKCFYNRSGEILDYYNCSFITESNKPGFLEVEPYFTEADQYVKVLYSAILTDLGSFSSDNILINASLLQEYTQEFQSAAGARQSYNELKDSGIGPLNITPSTIYAEYLCQVPQRKPIGPLLVSIFVADLVLLRAVWTILNWTTTAWTQRNQKAKFCEGCLATMARGTYELSPTALADIPQESSHALSEISVTSPRGSLRGHHRSESQQSLVFSPSSSEPN